MSDAQERTTGRIEGGIDAIVIGGGVDGYAAASLLGAANMHTVLLEAGEEIATAEPREFAPGYFCQDGEQVITHLDPQVIKALDLYRYGLSYKQRRMESTYFFSDGAALTLAGDFREASEGVAALSEEDAERFDALVESTFEQALSLKDFFAGGAAPRAPSRALQNMATSSVRDYLTDQFDDERLADLLTAEACLRSSVRPEDPYGYLSLVRRFAGEAAGLQGAVAFPEKGMRGLGEALRRAAQSAGVDIRLGPMVKKVLIEWDGAGGVLLEDGAQLRAPVIVNTLPAETAFIDQIGPRLIDIEFQHLLRQGSAAEKIGAAQVHFALKGTPRDEQTNANLHRRLVYAPSRAPLNRAYRMAHEKTVAAPLLMELVFSSMHVPSLAPEQGMTATAWIHPVPVSDDGDEAVMDAVRCAATETFEKIAPGVNARIEAVDAIVPLSSNRALSASGPMISAWERARQVTDASGIKGYFFCGPEAQIGLGYNGAAGRRAAKAAIAYARGNGGLL